MNDTGDDSSIAPLLREAGHRDAPRPEITASVRQVAHAEWQVMVARTGATGPAAP